MPAAGQGTRLCPGAGAGSARTRPALLPQTARPGVSRPRQEKEAAGKAGCPSAFKGVLPRGENRSVFAGGGAGKLPLTVTGGLLEV